MDVKMEPSWKQALSHLFDKPYFLQIATHLKTERATKTVIYPKGNLIFNAFNQTPYDNLKVVILGQDPYHGPNQANGLAFSVKDGVRVQPSLLNIFKEIKNDLGKDLPPTGNLERWAKQGVLLLNATLTVRAANAGSHQKKGWEEFTDAVVKKVNDHY